MLSKIKPYIYGGFGLFVLLLIIAVFILNSEVKDLQSDVIKKDAQIADLDKNAKVTEASGKITETTNVELHKGVEKRIQEQSVIREEVNSEVDRINEDFRSQEPATDESQQQAREQERAQAVSKARVSGLWKQYCSAQPNPSQCLADALGENK